MIIIYETADIIDKIHCADCLDFMRQMPDECVDMIFADPPFNVGKPYPSGDRRQDYYYWCGFWIAECFRMLKTTGTFYLMTIPRHLPYIFQKMNPFGVFVDQIIWNTTSLNANPKQFPRAYQSILQYGKTDQYVFHPKAQTIIRDHVVRVSQLKQKPELATGYPGRVCNLWDDIKFIAGGCMAPKEAILCKDSKKKAHPCQMPIALAERAILFSSNERDLICDPFIGSGTTAIAAIKTGRHYIGIDQSQEYVDIARERIRIEQNQLKLPL